MLTLFKKAKVEEKTKLLYNPVYDSEILGPLYKAGEMIGHVRMRKLTHNDGLFAGVTSQGYDSMYFVASHSKVIDHIEKYGCVPLIPTHHLRFFKDKKRMNAHLLKVKTCAA